MKNNILLLAGQFNNDKRTGTWGPFNGSAGYLLKNLLSNVGVRMDECAVETVFPFQVKPTLSVVKHMTGKRQWAIDGLPPLTRGKYIRGEFTPHLDRLYKSIEQIEPNVILAVGDVATWAALGTSKIASCRGVTNESLFGCKTIATHSMLAVMRDWTLRPTVLADIHKLHAQSLFKEFKKPVRELWINPSLRDMEDFFIQFILPSTELSIDIETAGEQITCVGFAPSIDRALVVPFWSHGGVKHNYWPVITDEIKAWRFVKQVCEETHLMDRARLALDKSPRHKRKIIGQNFLYDVKFLWEKYGITTPGMANDTMLLSHAQQPEMKKGLGYLASVHTDESSWKFMRTKSTRKKED